MWIGNYPMNQYEVRDYLKAYDRMAKANNIFKNQKAAKEHMEFLAAKRKERGKNEK